MPAGTNPVHFQTMPLLCFARTCCAAAADDAVSPVSCDALLSLLPDAPAPLVWQPDVVLAAALVGGCQDEVELDLPVVVSSTGGGTTILVEEVKLGAAGVHLLSCWQFCWARGV